MKLKTKIILLSVLPMICLGILLLGTANQKIQDGIYKEAYIGMQATTLAVKDVFEVGLEGEYHVDANGDLWKGEAINISKSTEIVDQIKEKTGLDITIFYQDTRYLTSIVDPQGNRQIGSKASEDVISHVLQAGEEYQDDELEILGTEYIAYYMPIYQDGSTTPIGMIFLGTPKAQVDVTIHKMRFELFAIAVSMILLVFVIAYVMSSAIAKAIYQDVRALAEIAEGNLGILIPEKIIKRKDAIGKMGRSILELDKRLTQIMDTIQTKSVLLSKSADGLDDAANRVAETIGQVDGAAQEIASGSTAQANDVEIAGNNVLTMGDMIDDTAKEVAKMNDTTQEMTTAADMAKTTLGKLTQTMEEVTDEIQRIYEQTNRTDESVKRISEVTELITQIASQTNLLSLNASIEAARAGEHGKGFAVVASEIQKLAEQSSHFAIEIQEILQQLTDNSDNAVKIMQGVKKIIVTQEKDITNTEDTFKTVQKGIEHSVEGIQTISKKTQVLDKTREEIVEIVRNLAAGAQQNAASTAQTAASLKEVSESVESVAKSADMLQKIAEDLEESTRIFHTKEQESA